MQPPYYQTALQKEPDINLDSIPHTKKYIYTYLKYHPSRNTSFISE
jgi:hypothetical protein